MWYCSCNRVGLLKLSCLLPLSSGIKYAVCSMQPRGMWALYGVPPWTCGRSKAHNLLVAGHNSSAICMSDLMAEDHCSKLLLGWRCHLPAKPSPHKDRAGVELGWVSYSDVVFMWILSFVYCSSYCIWNTDALRGFICIDSWDSPIASPNCTSCWHFPT